MSNQVNVNTSTSAVPEKIEVASGSGSVSFDELEAVGGSDFVPSRDQGEIAPDKKESKKTEKPSSGEGEGEGKEADDSKSSKDDKKEKENGKEKSEKSEKSKEVKSKIIKVKDSDGNTIELKSDLPFDVIVNGKKETIGLQELLNNYSGKTDWSRKYTELDKERKSIQSDKQMFTDMMTQFFNINDKEKDPMKAINYLGESLGHDMASFWRTFKQNIEPIMEERVRLTPEEKKLKDIEDELKYYQNRDQSAKQKQTEQAELEKVSAHVKKLQSENNISDENFYKLYQDLKTSGIVKPEDLTPELIVEYHKEIEARTALASTLDGINPDLKDKEQAVNILREVWMQNPELTIDDIKQLAIESYGSKEAINLSRKLQKAAPQTKNYSPQKTRDGFAISFDDVS